MQMNIDEAQNVYVLQYRHLMPNLTQDLGAQSQIVFGSVMLQGIHKAFHGLVLKEKGGYGAVKIHFRTKRLVRSQTTPKRIPACGTGTAPAGLAAHRTQRNEYEIQKPIPKLQKLLLHPAINIQKAIRAGMVKMERRVPTETS